MNSACNFSASAGFRVSEAAADVVSGNGENPERNKIQKCVQVGAAHFSGRCLGLWNSDARGASSSSRAVFCTGPEVLQWSQLLLFRFGTRAIPSGRGNLSEDFTGRAARSYSHPRPQAQHQGKLLGRRQQQGGRCRTGMVGGKHCKVGMIGHTSPVCAAFA